MASSAFKDQIVNGQLLLQAVSGMVSSTGPCEACGRDKPAVYRARVCKQRNIFLQNPQPYEVCACLKCMPLNCKKIRDKVSDYDEFLARKTTTLHKYARLIDAMEKQTSKVTNDSFLYDLRNRICDLGLTLNRYELQEAWRKLNG